MADTPQVAAAKFMRLAGKLNDQPYESVQRGALLTKNALRAALPDTLRGVGKKGAKITPRYTITRGSGDGSSALVFTTGPTHLIERDTKPHPIPKLKGSRSRKGGNTRLFGPAFGGVNTKKLGVSLGTDRFYAQVFHPGTKGKHLFVKTTETVSPLVRKQFDAGVALSIREVF